MPSRIRLLAAGAAGLFVVLGVCLALAVAGVGNSAAASAPPASTAPPLPTASALPVTAAGAPSGPPAPALSGNIPLAVAGLGGLPPNATPEQARPFFDTFSWQEFVALSWPVDPGAPRGTAREPANPAVFLGAAAGAQPVVWASYKADFELFDQGSQRPPAWDSPAIPVNPCGNVPAGTHVFTRVTKGDNLLQTSNQAFSYPLIDQNRAYVSYEVHFNRQQYELIRGADTAPASWLYLAKNLAAHEPVTMPASSPPSTPGALMVKAAWKVMGAGDDASRFYVVSALVYDPATKACSPQSMRLVGLHVVQKLAAFPEWIWSTFEQEDNVPPAVAAAGASAGASTHAAPRYSFNNGTPAPATVGGYADRPPVKAPQLQPPAQRKPVQVTRFNPIPASTAALSQRWKALLGGTVWRHYQLVFTQWPTNPGSFSTPEAGGIYPQASGAAFPVNGVTNTVMETYFQSQNDAAGAGGNSCMSCHYRAAQSDFSWSLMRDAH